jgi:hypothetical protein
MRAALFAPVQAGETDKVGHLVESAILSQWQHSSRFRQIRYARWRNEGEVDVVYLDEDQRPGFIGEIKWSDRIVTNFESETRSIQALLRRHAGIRQAFFTTRTVDERRQLDGRELTIYPSAVYCYTVGRTIVEQLGLRPQPELSQ